MTNNIFVFDRKIIRQNRSRAAAHLNDHGFLIDWSMDQILMRLQDIKREFKSALQIGCRTKKIKIENLITLDNAENLKPDILAEDEILPFAPESFDLIISPLNLHTTNDLPGALAQIKAALKPDGLFIAALLGGETLYELRDVMNKAEMELSGGLSPHVAPFADMPQMGALMQRAGFNLPVIDSEKITVTYNNALKLMEDLRRMGEGNALIQRKKKFSTRQFFAKINQDYAEHYSEADGRICATFEIIFVIGWSPHDSQQKPLKPGSATARLADVLVANEEKLPC